MEKKMTKKDRFNQLLALAEVKANDELVEFLNHELELLTRKADRTNSKQNKERDALAKALYDELVALDKLVTVSEFMALSPTVAKYGYSNQKVTAMFKHMVSVDMLERTVEKGKALYSVK